MLFFAFVVLQSMVQDNVRIRIYGGNKLNAYIDEDYHAGILTLSMN